MIAAAFAALCLPAAACSENTASLSRYDIDVVYDGENTLSGTTVLTYYNDTDNCFDSLSFNLWGNAYRKGAIYAPVSQVYQSKAYYRGDSYGGMEINGVEGGEEWQICGADMNILDVALAETLYPEQSVTIAIDYTLTLADVNHRTGVTENTVNLGNFYPVLCAYTSSGFAEHEYCSTGDPFVSEVADYDVTLTVPSSFKVAASGQLEGQTEEDGNTSYTYSLSCARDFAAVLSEKFEVLSAQAGGTTVYYYYYEDAQPQVSLEVAQKSVEYFSEKFGNYMYPTLSIAQTGFCMGGMEYPALTMISDAQDEKSAIYTIVHENAHQWWYAAVGSDQYLCGWQDEGLAEYSALMFFESSPAYGFTRTGLTGTAMKSYRAYYSVYNQLFGDADTSMNRPLAEYSGDYEYANIAYNKALLMFDAVRNTCGDRQFVDALSEYYKEYKGKIAPPEGLIAKLSKVADCEGIFSGFIEGKVII